MLTTTYHLVTLTILDVILLLGLYSMTDLVTYMQPNFLRVQPI